jgi:hypothetical protein
VYDAYHRVLHREFIDGENRAEAGRLADVESIDRVSCTDPGGHRTFGYRLRGSPAGGAEPFAGLREADGDGA